MRSDGDLIRALTGITCRGTRDNRSLSQSIVPAVWLWFTLGLALAIILLLPVSSWAHGFAGKRFFPTTFQVDDPFISDEFSVLINHIKDPDARTTEIDIDYSKRILPNFGLEFHEAHLHQEFNEGGSANGWDNLGVGVKWQFLTDEKHELIMSAGTDIDIGGTGAKGIGASSFSTISPGLFFGKGFGDLPESVNFLRPFAITGVISPSFPTKRDPDTLTWAFTVQYSLVYLQSFVKDIGLGQPFNHMVLVTEFPMTTCLARDCKGQTTGTVNPGVVWFTKKMGLGIAAQIPVNERTGHNVGVLGLVHFFIDDLFPKSIGRPIFQ